MKRLLLVAWLLAAGTISGCCSGPDPVVVAALDAEIASLGRMALINAPFSGKSKADIAADVSKTLANACRATGRDPAAVAGVATQ